MARYILLIFWLDLFKDEDDSEKTNKDDAARAVWSAAELPDSTLLSRGSTICGTFQVTDSHLVPSDSITTSSSNTSHNNDTDSRDYSYVDFSFGTSRFAGSHRFSIHRRRLGPGESYGDSKGEGEAVEVRFTHLNCNPTQDGPPPALVQYLSWIHQPYARLLVADGLRVVLGG